ncbi:hypothetical protein [Streptomyces sp. YIM S03343]
MDRILAPINRCPPTRQALPEPQRTQLVAEMATSRRWLNSRTDAPNPKPKPKQSRRAGKTADAKKPTAANKTGQRKKAKNPLNGARPLPGVVDPRTTKRLK